MSLVPLFFGDLLQDFDRPSQLLDQHFGVGLLPQDLFEPMTVHSRRRPYATYMRPWRSALSKLDTGSTVTADKDKYQVSLDVQQFAPEEITVKTVDDSVVVEGKHEEKQDEHGYISRHFVRRYALPKGHDVKDVVSALSSDGVLTITAPRKALEGAAAERSVPITHTGPAKIKQGEKMES